MNCRGHRFAILLGFLAGAYFVSACAAPAASTVGVTQEPVEAASTAAPLPKPTEIPTETSVPSPTMVPPTNTPDPTHTPTIPPTLIPTTDVPALNADVVAGTWSGNAAGKIGGRDLPPSPVEITISESCTVNKICGVMKYQTGCAYQIQFQEIDGQKYIFRSTVSGGDPRYCIVGRSGTFSLELRSDGTANFLSQDTTTEGENVFATGILIKK